MKNCLQILNEAQALVDAQARDEGLWFIAATAPEAYLQQALRELHRVIEQERCVESSDSTVDPQTEGS